MTTQTTTTKSTLKRTVLAGAAAGIVFNVVGFLTFVLLGTGINHGGPLLDPGLQSHKMIEVWTRLEPLPKFDTQPALILAIYVSLGIIYALMFRSVASAWPPTFVGRTARLATAIWALTCVPFELLGPWNLLGEPIALVLLELGFWAVMATAAAAVIVRSMGRESGGRGGAVQHAG